MITLLSLALAFAQAEPDRPVDPDPVEELAHRVEELEHTVEEHQQAADDAAGEVEKLLQALGYEDLEEAVQEFDEGDTGGEMVGPMPLPAPVPVPVETPTDG